MRPTAAMMARAALRSAIKLPGYYTAGDGFGNATLNTTVAVRRWSETLIYETAFGVLPNYVRPTTYTEKVQWRKMFDRNPDLVTFSDKIAARSLAKQRAPDVALPELYWFGDDADTIPFRDLKPPYVMKASNRSSANVFVFEGTEVDEDQMRAKARRWITARPHRRWGHEWTYGMVPNRVMIEEFLPTDDGHDLPPDLKVFVFGGRARYVYHRDGTHRRILDADWTPREWDRWARLGAVKRHRYDADVNRPDNLEKAITIAEAIAGDIDHLRVDLYLIGERIYFGEATVFPSGGNKTWIRSDDPADPHPDRDVDTEMGSHWLLDEPDRSTMIRRGLGRAPAASPPNAHR